MGLEKLNAGRGSWEPPIEYSDDIEGDRATEWFVQGVKGECALEMLDVGDKFLACNESYEPPKDMSSTSSELSAVTDLMLGECLGERKEPGDRGGSKPG
jgi:hypothetical protein